MHDSATPRAFPKDDQIFLMMGQSFDNEGIIAIVLAPDSDAAQVAFRRQYKDASPVSWPSMLDMRETLEKMTAAINGDMTTGLPVVDGFAAPPEETGYDVAKTSPWPFGFGYFITPEIRKVLSDLRAQMIEAGINPPFDSSEISYEGETFSVFAPRLRRAECPGEFRWRNVIVRWERHWKIDSKINRELSAEELAQLRGECMAELAARMLARPARKDD
jgi:hypothetical protein